MASKRKLNLKLSRGRATVRVPQRPGDFNQFKLQTYRVMDPQNRKAGKRAAVVTSSSRLTAEPFFRSEKRGPTLPFHSLSSALIAFFTESASHGVARPVGPTTAPLAAPAPARPRPRPAPRANVPSSPSPAGVPRARAAPTPDFSLAASAVGRSRGGGGRGGGTVGSVRHLTNGSPT